MVRRQEITLTVNGRRYQGVVDARRSLADFLREDLDLTGTHLGCEQGVCGACTVLVDGRAVRSCLLFAVQCDGAKVVTIEGLAAPDGTMHPLQAAFYAHHGLQCGFCTPGFLFSTYELLSKNPRPSEEETKDALSGNLCRCTGYQGILEAVQSLSGIELPQPPGIWPEE